jgi:NADH:ubiquinone oxidoreductase subunit F (NADH-binding)/NADH:ubiquinone oxidoreductase subunit E
MPSHSRARPIDPDSALVAEKFGADPEAVVEALRLAQARHGRLTSTAVEAIAQGLHLPAARVYGVATFYSMLGVAATTSPDKTARVCDGPACWLKGAAKARTELEARLGAGWRVERSSCLGLCDQAPAALLEERPVGGLPTSPELVEATPASTGAAAYALPRPGEVRVMLARAGQIDPDSINSALDHGAYGALETALTELPESVLAEVEAAGLQGRGGAGFPTARKWRMVERAAQHPKYVVCNADEAEPLVFKDRVLIDSDPHQLLEGMALAGYAIGASEGYIYIRGEYAPQAARLERAIAQAEACGCLGDHIFDTDFSFHIHVHRGAGAYICGEETALLESLEGRRGEPRLRPPYPTTHGYHALPTLINNVETFSAVPAIIDHGAGWWRGLSSAATPGTKLYLLLGHVNRPGLFEAPFGLTLRQIIDDFGGGMRPGATFRFALTGGAAGSVVPPSLLDVPIDYASAGQGVSLGAGAFLVCDQTVSPVSLLRELLHFFEVESCGQCTPCRIGTLQSRQILDRLAAGQGRAGDVDELSRLADTLQRGSLCGLGRSAAIPMQSALQHFRQDFEAAGHDD